MTPDPDGGVRAVGNAGRRSLSFDRAVAFYDRTRRLSPDAAARIAEILAAELRGRGRCLEVGVGNGRMALPLHGRSIPMAGIDLSMEMLRSLVDRADGTAPFPLAVADATEAPFRDGTFGAALACHVLHLIRPWRRALGEMARVVRPGGVVLTARRRAAALLRPWAEDRFGALDEDRELPAKVRWRAYDLP
ncbi:MAG: class I SAM-dependent methyltransferase [Chloroflexota bacterium]|nr:class I SAM-dependent methyltransferase [Chloroflexota bacterium]